MNSQRLVAAVAALAIGFGVTLIGVAVDDGDEVVVTADASEGEVADVQDVGDPSAGADEPAEQEEEPADEPEPAEVESPATTDGSAQSQEAPSRPAETAPATSVEMEMEEVDDFDDSGLPLDGPACVDVVTLSVDSVPVEFVVVAIQPGSLLELLGRRGAFVVQLSEGFVPDFVPRIVEFDDGLPVEFGDVCDDGDSFEDGDDPFADDDPTIGGSADGSIVPCEGLDIATGAVEVFDALSPRYGDVLSFDDPSDLEAYRFLVAATAERTAAGSFSDFFEAVESTTSAFRTECPFDIDSFTAFERIVELFIEDELDDADYDELLCNLARLSADSRLVDFLGGPAQAFDTNCDYAEET